MKSSESVHIEIRGLDYHCRIWGDKADPTLFFLHGYQDNSASWQFTVDALAGNWRIVAPDWRGYGLTGWTGQDTYWLQDMVGDLDALLDHFAPDDPVDIVAHSMGATAAALYAGAIPGRISRLLNIEGFTAPENPPDELPRRLARWLQQIAGGEEQRPYASFEEFAERMATENPRLTPERALYLARHWGKEAPEGGVIRRADPAHKALRPTLFRADEVIACLRRIRAEVMWVEGGESDYIDRIRGVPGGYEDRLAAMTTLADVAAIPGAGHNVHHDQPERLAEVIDRFMRPKGLR